MPEWRRTQSPALMRSATRADAGRDRDRGGDDDGDDDADDDADDGGGAEGDCRDWPGCLS